MLGALIALAGCHLDLSEAVRRPERQDASRRDGSPLGDAAPGRDAELDAAFADAEDTADAGTPDAAPADGAPADAAPRDAAPAQDATTGLPDAAPDAAPGSPDARVDAGSRDAAAPDAAPVDSGCSPWPLSPTPTRVANVPVDPGSPLDAPLMVADVDADGLEELVAARLGVPGSLSVVAFPPCAALMVDRARADVREPPVLSTVPQTAASPAIYVPAGNKAAVWTYSPSRNPKLVESPAAFEEPALTNLRGGVSAPSGTGLTFLAELGGVPGFVYYSPSAGAGDFHGLPSAVTVSPAYLSAFAPGGPSFVAASDGALRFLRPTPVSRSLSSFEPTADPVVLADFGTRFGAGNAVIAQGAGSGLRIVRFDALTLGSSLLQDQTLALPAELIAEPVPQLRGNVADELRLYLLLSSEILTYCTINVNVSTGVTRCLTPSAREDVSLVGQARPNLNPITAYVDGDTIPDLIVPLAGGRVLFFLNGDLTGPADHVVDTGISISAAPALLFNAFARHGIAGHLLAVPHVDGSVSFVAWLHAFGAPVDTRALWRQFRRDAARTGAF